MEHLGFILNSTDMTVSLTSKKKISLLAKCRDMTVSLTSKKKISLLAKCRDMTVSLTSKKKITLLAKCRDMTVSLTSKKKISLLAKCRDMTVSLTSKKKISLLAKCREVINCKAPSIRAVAELIGILVSSFTGVEFGHLHYRQLELEKVLALKRVAGDYEKKCFLSERAKAEIQWWSVNVNSELRHIEHGKMLFTLTTDASTEGWGAVFESILEGDPQSTGGRWTLEEIKAHINKLELKAGMLGLQTFCSGIYNVHVKIYLDNTTYKPYGWIAF